MNSNSEKKKNDSEKNRYNKTVRKQEVVRPSSIMSNTSTRTTVKTQAIRENGRYHSRSGSISRTSFLSERNVTDRGGEPPAEVSLSLRGSPAPRRTHRANSLPASCSRRYSFETNLRQTRLMAKKTGQSKKRDEREIECRSAECIFHQRMSLDLSQLSDFADSEGESRDTVGRQGSRRADGRRRRSVDKANRVDRGAGSQVARSTSNSPSSKVSSCSHKLTRRSSLQSFSPRALTFASSFDNASRLCGAYPRAQDERRRAGSATALRKSSLGSSLSRHSELVFSSNSPDYTSDASTCEFSPCKLSPGGAPAAPGPQKPKHADSAASNRATISPNSQVPCVSSSSSCYTSWVESERTYQRENESMDGNVSESTPMKEKGEWNNFWQNYNSSLAAFPTKFFYDDCPTPFYEPNGNIDMKAFEIDPTKTEAGKNAGDKGKGAEPSGFKAGDRRTVALSRSEAREMIHCAHRLAEILTLALDRSNAQMAKKESAETAKKSDKGSKAEGEEPKSRDKKSCAVPEKGEAQGKPGDRGERKRQELKDITVIRGDSKDVLL